MTNRLSREHRRLVTLMLLQYIFFIGVLACMIVLIWCPEKWIQLAVTSALLIIAGSVCKSSRS